MKKMISWNVNGLRACMKKGFQEYFEAADADIFCLQETKLQEGQIDLELPGYHQYWNYAEKKGYSGARPCLPKRSRFLFAMVSESKNMIWKAV